MLFTAKVSFIFGFSKSISEKVTKRRARTHAEHAIYIQC